MEIIRNISLILFRSTFVRIIVASILFVLLMGFGIDCIVEQFGMLMK